MQFPCAQVDNSTFTPSNPIIKMDHWVQPQLFNSGDANVIVLGQVVLPGERFLLGGPMLEMVGDIRLVFQQGSTQQVIVSYFKIQK